MATVAQPQTPSKTPKAFYVEMYNGEMHGVLTQVHGVLSIFTDDGQILDYEPAMAPWITLLGEVALAETARLLDAMAGNAAQIACSRLQEVA